MYTPPQLKIKNGVLTKEGKKIFAVKELYYPSFHNTKQFKE